jgi:hypothetical protein
VSLGLDGLALNEALHVPTGAGPLLGDTDDVPRRSAASKRRSEGPASGLWTLDNHLYAAVGEIRGRADEPELQRRRPHPPAEADTLNAAADERRKPYVSCFHGIAG